MSPARRALLGLGAAAILVGSGVAALPASSAETAEATVALPAKPGKNVVHYTGHAPFNNGSTGIVADDPQQACEPDGNSQLNDQHRIKVVVPKQVDPRYDTLIRFQIDWDYTGNESLADMALHLFGPDGKLVATSDGSQASEGINLTEAAPGVYDALVCAFQTGPGGQDYRGTVTAQTLVPPKFPAARGVPTPSYRQYSAPKGQSTSAGEPSIGSNWKTGATMFTSYTDEYKVTFDDKRGTSTWTVVNDKTSDPSNKISLDPIGFTDSKNGRTFVSQLYLACSAMAFSDDDFASQPTISEGCGSGINGFDHQTVGAGPYPKGMGPLPTSTYPNAVYYCSQAPGLLTPGATCSRSDDGGISFGNPVQIYDAAGCSGIHGHIRVAPDGTAYVPNAKCGGNQGVVFSKDGGQTWTLSRIPDSIEGSSDPSVAAGRDGTVYFGYADGTGKPRIAVSTTGGRSWARSVDVGLPFGIHNTEFSEVIAGDGDRAAFAFLGTPTRGSTQADSFGKSADGKRFVGGEWHLYVATTYDRGRTWTTVDATPRDPVQRGCIWNSGGSNPCRNLLDFNDITVDKTGHVMVGFADGCVPASIEPTSAVDTAKDNDCTASTLVAKNGLVNHGAIVRQVGGLGLFRAYDPKPAGRTARTSLSAARTGAAAAAAGVAAAGTATGAAATASQGAPVATRRAASSLPMPAAVGGLALLVALALGGAFVLTRRHRRA